MGKVPNLNEEVQNKELNDDASLLVTKGFKYKEGAKRGGPRLKSFLEKPKKKQKKKGETSMTKSSGNMQVDASWGFFFLF